MGFTAGEKGDTGVPGESGKTGELGDPGPRGDMGYPGKYSALHFSMCFFFCFMFLKTGLLGIISYIIYLRVGCIT